MNKFKKIMLGALSVLTLGLFVVTGSKVEAASLENGTVLVSTTTYAGDTKTWGFTTNLPKSNTSIAVGSDINGIVSAKDGTNGTKSAPIAIKSSASNAYDTYPGAEFLVPVPSADSTGTVTRTGNVSKTDGSDDRYMKLGTNEQKYLGNPMTFDFDTNDIETNPTLSNNSTVTGYYLRFVVSGGEAKTYSISVQLKDGTTTYGEVATLHTVTYMDGTKTLLTDDKVVDGSNVSYEPKKYGYDFEGWYTNSSLSSETKINKETYTVTTDVTLYSNWTAWTNTGIEELTLSNAAIEKIATGIAGNLSADLALAPSIYTAMTGVGMTTTDVILPGESSSTQPACFNTNGAVKTDGNGLKFTAPANGTLTAYVGSGGGSQRNIKLTDGTDVLDPTTGSVVVGNIESARYTPVEITYTLEKGTTYYFGGDNGVRIYYISFEPEMAYGTQAMVKAELNSTGDTVRFIGGILLNDLDLANVQSIELILKLDGVATSKQIFLTTCYTSVTGASIACPETKGVYYVIYRVTGVKDLTGTISKQLKVTFTDGSTTLSEVTEIAL